MLLDTYASDNRFWIKNLFGATSDGLQAFRGDFVVKEGELKAAAGKRNPPVAVIKQAASLADQDRIQMIAGNFASIDELPEFIERFDADLADGCKPVFFIDDIPGDAVVEINGRDYVLIHFSEGMAWNELMELFYIEKSDLKGISGEDKVKVLGDAAKDFDPKYERRTLEEMLAAKTGTKREAWGAV